MEHILHLTKQGVVNEINSLNGLELTAEQVNLSAEALASDHPAIARGHNTLLTITGAVPDVTGTAQVTYRRMSLAEFASIFQARVVDYLWIGLAGSTIFDSIRQRYGIEFDSSALEVVGDLSTLSAGETRTIGMQIRASAVNNLYFYGEAVNLTVVRGKKVLPNYEVNVEDPDLNWDYSLNQDMLFTHYHGLDFTPVRDAVISAGHAGTVSAEHAATIGDFISTHDTSFNLDLTGWESALPTATEDRRIYYTLFHSGTGADKKTIALHFINS